MKCAFLAGTVAGVLLLASASSQAAILAKIWENQPGPATNALISNAPGSAPDAQFNPTAINFDSLGSAHYTIGSFFNNPSFFATSGGFSPTDSLNNTYTLFTGSTFLSAGANNFVTPHDDGFELSIPGAFSDAGFTNPFDLQQPGPTSPVSTPYTVYAPSAGLYTFTLAYGECCGAPATLAFEVNGVPVGGVPEPASLALLGLSLAGLAGLRRKT